MAEGQLHYARPAMGRDVFQTNDKFCKALWPLNSIFGFDKVGISIVFCRCLLFLGIPPLVLVGISWYEDTLFLEGDGVGLLEHFGFLVFFVIHMLLILLLPRTIRKCATASSRISQTIDYCEVQEQNAVSRIAELFKRANQFLAEGKYTKTKIIALMVGVMAVLQNVLNTIKPEQVYHHDVWDSTKHIGGYVGAKIYLLFTWGFVLPIIIYFFIAVCFQLFRIYSQLSRIGPSGVVNVSPLNPDKVGGLKHINVAMISIIVNIFPLGLFTVALIFVHGLTLPLVAWTAGWVLLLCAIFFLPLSSVHIAMSKRKQLIIGEIDIKFNEFSEKLRVLLRKTSGKEDSQLTETLKSMEQLHSAYTIADKMPIWPFDFNSLAKFSSVVVLHLILTTISGLVGRIL